MSVAKTQLLNVLCRESVSTELRDGPPLLQQTEDQKRTMVSWRRWKACQIYQHTWT